MMSPKLLFHGIENNLRLNIVVSISRLLCHRIFGGVGLGIIVETAFLFCQGMKPVTSPTMSRKTNHPVIEKPKIIFLTSYP